MVVIFNKMYFCSIVFKLGIKTGLLTDVQERAFR